MRGSSCTRLRNLPGRRRLYVCAILLTALGCGSEEPAAPPEAPPILLPDIGAALQFVYENRDLAYLASILSAETGAEFRFLVGGAAAANDSLWTRDEFLHRHQRLLDPAHTSPGEPPVPAALWLQGVTITLVPVNDFEERHDVYSEDGGLDGRLDPERWRALGARFTSYFLLQMAGETDYRMEGESDFVLIEDRLKNSDDPRRFWLYRWEDRCGTAIKTPSGRTRSRACFSDILALYAP